MSNQDCWNHLKSYIDAESHCVAPADASCQQLSSGARGCIFLTDDHPPRPAVDHLCRPVSVVGDATYCVIGTPCGDLGDNCPKRGDVAKQDCWKQLKSYVDAESRCVAPTDATCRQLSPGSRGCVFD